PPVSPPVHQQPNQRHSTSPIRVVPADVSRRLSDSEINTPPKVMNSARIVQLSSNVQQNPLYSKASMIQQSIDLL
ncbi:unnamed protein product, partial [Lymnaea stagnalis]